MSSKKSGPSLRKAINDKCQDCIYDIHNVGNWRQQIALCSVTSCPLWVVRPVCSADLPDNLLAKLELSGQPYGGAEHKFKLTEESSDDN